MTTDPIPPTLRVASETTEPAPEPALDPGSPGRSLRRARERAGLSVEELAAQLKLSRATLDALERDDFNSTIEPVYVRGYYRKCAKVLALPEDELIAAYERLVVPPAPKPPSKLLIGREEVDGGRVRGRGDARWLIAVGVAVVLGIVLWAANRRPATSHGPVTATVSSSTVLAPVPRPAAPPAVPTAPPPAAVPAAAPPVSEAVVPAAPSAAAGAVQNPASSSSSSSSSETAVAPGTLTLDFRATSWVRIEDADNQVLLSGTIEAGQQKSVDGKPPYSVFLGNAPGVGVTYEGKPVDVTPYLKPNSTARLRLP